MTRYLFCFVAALLCTTGFAADLTGDADAGLAKSAVCSACHGADGNSLISTNPSLAGQHANYITKRLMEMKNPDNAQSYPIMSSFASALSDQDVADIAAYFKSQSVKPGAADNALVDAGAAVYRLGNEESKVASCAACHGPKGQGNPTAQMPAIAGQRADYVISQLNKFANGQRDAGFQNMMHGVAVNMSDADIKAVASYIEGLH